MTETLSSLLIIVPAMVMLAGAIVSAANINNNARTSVISKLPEFTETGTAQNITKSGNVTTFSGGTIAWCKESDSIYYYLR